VVVSGRISHSLSQLESGPASALAVLNGALVPVIVARGPAASEARGAAVVAERMITLTGPKLPTNNLKEGTNTLRDADGSRSSPR
jgi:hypothetical protein